MPGGFQPGNKAAAGRRGNVARPSILTQALLSQLNEIDKNTGQAKLHALAAQLIKLALGFDKKVKVKGKAQTVHVEGDLAAIHEVFDRVQGKAPQQVELNGDVTRTINISMSIGAASGEKVLPRATAKVVEQVPQAELLEGQLQSAPQLHLNGHNGTSHSGA